MKITAKKYKMYPSGAVKWHISIDNKCPVDMYRNGNNEICLTWCDKDFDICTVKMYRGASLYEIKALLKALSYTL